MAYYYLKSNPVPIPLDRGPVVIRRETTVEYEISRTYSTKTKNSKVQRRVIGRVDPSHPGMMFPKYGTTEGTCNLDASPMISNVADSPLTIYWRVTADHYETTTGSAKVTISKAAQSVPAAPTAESCSGTAITLAILPGGEYSVDNENWTDSREFNNLAPNTAYTFYQRLKGDANHEASPASSASISTIGHVHNWSYSASGAEMSATCGNADGGHGGTLTSTLTAVKPEHAVYGDGKSAEAAVTGSIDGVATPAVVYRKGTEILTAAPEDAGSYQASITLGDATASVAYEIAKAAQAAPAAPTAESVTENSVTLKQTEGYQYSLDGTAWQDSNVFSGLSQNKEYTFYQRIAGDANHETSPASQGTAIRTGSYVYRLTATGDDEHTIESGKDAVYIVKRSVEDDRTFDNYTGATVDGKEIPENGSTAEKGSLILTLKSSYLDTLSVGDHKVTILFTDGTVEAPLKIKATAPTPRPVPQTGDKDTPVLWIGLILLGIAGLAVLAVLKSFRKRK